MTSRKGLNGACSVHEYTGSFVGQSSRFKMTSVCGHVMTLDFIGIASSVNCCSVVLCVVIVLQSTKEDKEYCGANGTF